MVDDAKISGQHLIESLKAGDEEAFTRIYKEYWYRMFLVAYRKLQNKEVAEEMIQDIFTRLWKERAKLQIASLDYYLFSAVRYEVIDHIRTQGAQAKYLDYYKAFSSFEDCNTEDVIVYNDLSKVVDEGIEILPEKSREIFKLHRQENWSVSQIASHYQLSEKAVEYHLTKATKSLRSHLKDELILLILWGSFFYS